MGGWQQVRWPVERRSNEWRGQAFPNATKDSMGRRGAWLVVLYVGTYCYTTARALQTINRPRA